MPLGSFRSAVKYIPSFTYLHQPKMVGDVATRSLNLSHFKMVEAMRLKTAASSSMKIYQSVRKILEGHRNRQADDPMSPFFIFGK
jgi:hypothetical protein